MRGRALVLGGGGVTGVAWELGILAGLAEAGVDLSTADVVVGTSAGSVVGALITGGVGVQTAYEHQLRPATKELAAPIRLALILRLGAAGLGRDPRRARARIGAMALAATTVPEQVRREAIAARLAGADWSPRQRLLITAVAADDGEFVVFDRDSGVSLVDAVAASCSVPGVWPPTTVGGRRYVDGGIQSPANVDLAAGCNPVVVLAPITISTRRSGRVAAQVAALPAGTRTLVISPDAAARRVIGRQVLDPSRRASAARAGRTQAATVVEAVRAVWAAS